MIGLSKAHEIIAVARGDKCTDEDMEVLINQLFTEALKKKLTIERYKFGVNTGYLVKIPGSESILVELESTIKKSIEIWLKAIP